MIRNKIVISGREIEVCKTESKKETISNLKTPKAKYNHEQLKKFLCKILILKNKYEKMIERARNTLKELKDLNNVV